MVIAVPSDNSDLIACVVIARDGERTRRFLVIDVLQLILVEPDQRRLGWGVAKFVGFLQVRPLQVFLVFVFCVLIFVVVLVGDDSNSLVLVFV